jgi:hypothetical protein
VSNKPDDQPLSIEELEALSDHELRERAFAAAEHRHDLGFFWDLAKHLRSAEDFSSDDGSAGGLGESVTGVIGIVTELLGRHDDSTDPLIRARYIDYLHNGK